MSSGTDMKIFSLVFLAACGLAACHRTTCGPAYGMDPFDEQRFSGDWFVVGVGQPEGRIRPTSCMKAHYNATGQGNATFVNLSVLFKTDTGDKINIKGHPSVPGVNSVLQAVMKKENDTEWSTVIIKYSVIGTDYDAFAVIHSCFESYDQVNDRFVRNPTFHIWSRTKTLDATILSTLQAMGSGLEHESVENMEIIDNSGC